MSHPPSSQPISSGLEPGYRDGDEPEAQIASAGQAEVTPVRPSTTRVMATWIVALSLAAVLASVLQVASGQREHGFFLLSLCLVVCFGATWVDVATRRIPNVLTYPAILLGLLLNGALPLVLDQFNVPAARIWLASSGTIDCLQGFGLCAAIGIVSFMARGLGGGDVKLLAAVGALIGFSAVIGVLFNTLAVAAVLGIANWAVSGSLMRRVQSLASAIYFSVVLRGDLRTVYTFKSTEGPFALSLLIGLVMAQFVALHRVLLAAGW